MPLHYAVLATVSGCYSPSKGRLPTCYSPVRHSTCPPKGTFAFDLHVWGTPPALILSQDQTLVRICLWNIISYWLFVQYPIMTLLQSFVRELYRSSSWLSKFIDMDTLYLVFKHQFQIVFGLPYRLKNFVSSKRGLYPNTGGLSSDLRDSRECYFSQTKTASAPTYIGRKIVTDSRRPTADLPVFKVEKKPWRQGCFNHDVFKIPAHLFCLRGRLLGGFKMQSY